MKLYTEEQVRKAIELSRDTHQEGKPYLERDEYDYSIEEVVDLLTPIELPSEEEIVDKALEVQWSNTLFQDGAKYVINKIQGGKS